MEVDEYMEDGEVEDEDEERKRHSEWKISSSSDQNAEPATKPSTTFTFNDPELFKKRAERFGLNEENAAKPVTKEQMVALYEELQVPSEEVKLLLEGESSPHFRFEAIHVHGTDEMSTKDLFDYFNGFNPASIEWINDSSCNMVWLETWQAAKALLQKSTETVKIEPKLSDTDAMDQEASEESSDKPSLPQGVWRKGLPHAKSESLFFRFATVTDCKVKGAQKFSSYYVKHGNPNYGGMKGLISTSRKRRIEDMRRGKKDPSAAVDSKNPWGSLALEWGADEQESWQRRFESKTGSRGLSSDVVRRLGYEPPRPSPSRSRDTDSENSEEDLEHSDSDESVGESRATKKRPRMRMYADEEEGKRRKGKNRAADSEDFGDKIAKLRSQQRIQDRLGPASDLRSKIKRRLN